MKSSDHMDPIPRRHIYDLFWYFVSERQHIFERRLAGQSPPWTDDPIMREHKLTNVFRASDRVSQYMIKKVCYGGANNEDLVFQIVMFRLFSRIETWESLQEILGHYPLISDLADGSLEDSLNSIKDHGEKLYTGAFILCATDAYGRSVKHLNHIELMKEMFVKGDFYESIISARNLEAVYDKLHSYPLLGDFMSYQIAIDLNYSVLINFSENDFVKAGPGACRGIRKCFVDCADMNPEQIIMWLVERQDYEFDRLNLKFNGLFGRKIHAIDMQNCLCEIDKYCRKAAPELASNRTRIKAKYKRNETTIDYFFPPKWRL